MHWERKDFIAAVEVCEFDQDGDSEEVAAEFGDELSGGGGGATGCEEVVDEDEVIARGDRVFVDFDDGFAVFEGVGDLASFPWEFAFFADEDETAAEAVGDGGGEDEAASVDADDFIDWVVLEGFAEAVDGEFEQRAIGKDGGDVFEDDAWGGEIDDIADGVMERLV